MFPPSSPASRNWHDLYLAVLFERNPDEIPLRISEAEAAIVERSRELTAASSGTRKERLLLDYSWDSLRSLRRIIEPEYEWRATAA
jgi:hypothetical protein